MIDEPTHGEQPRLLAGENGKAARNHRIFPRGRSLRLIVLAVFVLIVLLGAISSAVQKWLWMRQLSYAGVFWTLLAVLAFYAYVGLLQISRGGQMEVRSSNAVPHLSFLFFVLAASWGWGFYLDHYELLYSTRGVVYGAGYTADHVTRIAFWIMTGAAVALCTLLALNAFRPRFRAIVDYA